MDKDIVTMREISFVKRIKFNFNGSVTKRALVIGDADNDQQNELICANLQGDLAIFKGTRPHSFAFANNLGMVTACTVGDVLNSGRNFVTAINMEGWLFIFDVIPSSLSSGGQCDASNCDRQTVPDGRPASSCEQAVIKPKELEPIYEQRMPANCKELLLADLDGDGQNELIIGLTDRVLRTYKWVKIGPERGKFVGLYKWEFADQIGSVSLNPSCHENCQDIIVAQPGGTYAKLECFDKKPLISSASTPGSLNEHKLEEALQQAKSQQQYSLDSPADEDNVRTEYVSKLTPEYHQLALAQMRNHHVSTEVLGSIKDGKDSSSYSLIVIATLDGTLMLVNKDETLWSLQVDHQLFALAVLEPPLQKKPSPSMAQSESSCTIIPNTEDDQIVDVDESDATESRAQHFVACAWNGKTYIIDEERNYLRFKFGEAVSAFTAGNYFFDGQHHASLVYATFNNQIILYYDVLLDSIRPMYLLKELMNNPEHHELLQKLERLADLLDEHGPPASRQDGQVATSQSDEPVNMSRLYNTLNDLLYNINDHDLNLLQEVNLRGC